MGKAFSMVGEKMGAGQLGQVADQAKAELGCNANRVPGMSAQNGGFSTAHSLCARPGPSAGVTNLHLATRLDLTMANLVQRAAGRDFFSALEIKKAQSLTGVGEC